jgi:transcriptional regulator with GAF, ATPase, and Fis domain
MSSEVISSHHKLLGKVETLLGQIESPEPTYAKEISRSKKIGSFLNHLCSEIASIKEAVRDLSPVIQQSRLAELSTRLAIHFFTERSMHRFCEKVLDELIQETDAHTGAFILFKENCTEVQVVAARNNKRKSLPPDRLRVSRTILARILSGESSVLVEDALSDCRLSTERSTRELSLRSVLAIPLRVEDYLAGAIHLENEAVSGVFNEQDLELLLDVGKLVTVYLNSTYRLHEEITARHRLYSELKGRTHFDGVVGSSPALLKVLEIVEQVGPSEATVIIEGESGTGKELVARALHQCSKRSQRPLVVVNCAAIPDALLESELFGHERGAYTGAYERQIGKLELADKGTVFLDEVAELSMPVQAKLLRFLQYREIERLGGSQTRKLDVRLIAATSRNTQGMVKSGKFREDLFYRLYVIPIKVPPLRERTEDIPLLIDHFVRVFSLHSGRECPEISPEVYDIFQEYTWPGNVRELENLVHRLIVLCKSGRIEAKDLPSHLFGGKVHTLDIEKNPFIGYMVSPPATWSELKRRRKQMLHIASYYAQKLEDKFIEDLLDKTGGNVSRAAQLSGMHRTLLHRKLRVRSQ